MAAAGTIKPALRVGIVGAGIGGLSLALALRERGLQADVFEQAQELTEIGAAIGLAGNGIREYARLGLLDELAAASTIPTELIYRHWQDGSRIAAHPVRKDDWYEKQFGAPWFGIHRADLQNILGRAFGVENLHLVCRLVNIVEQRSRGHAGVRQRADPPRRPGGRRRRSTLHRPPLDDRGRRCFVLRDQRLPRHRARREPAVPPDPHAIQFWMGPDGHLLHYAIGGGGEAVNFFAVVEGPRIWMHDGSVAEVQEDVPVASFRGWHPAVTEMIKAASSPIRWGLFTVRPLLRWYRGRVVILGDAAHGMLPHHGQGANTSIEDAFVLAGLLARPGRMTLSRSVHPLPGGAPRPDPQDPAQLVGHQLPAAPGGRAGRAGTQPEGGHGARGVRLDPLVRRAAGAGQRPGRHLGAIEVTSSRTGGKLMPAGRGARGRRGDPRRR